MISRAVVVLTFTAASSQAAVIIYGFVGLGLGGTPASEPVAFQLTVPDFQSPPESGLIYFTCDQLDSSTNCKAPDWIGVLFLGYGYNNPAFSAVLQFNANNNWDYLFYFPAGAFTTPGIHIAEPGYNPGTLTVSETGGAPEPATILFVMSGLCLCGFSRLRTRR